MSVKSVYILPFNTAEESKDACVGIVSHNFPELCTSESIDEKPRGGKLVKLCHASFKIPYKMGKLKNYSNCIICSNDYGKEDTLKFFEKSDLKCVLLDASIRKRLAPVRDWGDIEISQKTDEDGNTSFTIALSANSDDYREEIKDIINKTYYKKYAEYFKKQGKPTPSIVDYISMLEKKFFGDSMANIIEEDTLDDMTLEEQSEKDAFLEEQSVIAAETIEKGGMYKLPMKKHPDISDEELAEHVAHYNKAMAKPLEETGNEIVLIDNEVYIKKKDT